MKETRSRSSKPASRAKPASARTNPVARKQAGNDYAEEIRKLRAEVASLQSKLAKVRGRSEIERVSTEERQPLLKIAATVAVTYALGKLIQALRLPTAATIAIPMVAAEVNRRFL
jgi:hypothetical protein